MDARLSKLIVFACSLIISLTFSPSLVHAATYYVDNGGGSNSNNGTSSSTPWASISKINSSTFNPGDSILFKAGDTWREELMPPSSGTSSSPITFGSYGNGAQPIISGADLLSSGWTSSTALSGSVTQANMKLSTASGTAFVDFSGTGGVTLSSFIGDQITVCSVTASSQCVTGYIKAAGTGETYGSQLLSNTDFSTTTGIGTYNSTIASVAGGQSGNALQISVTSGSSLGLATESFSTTSGALLKLSAYSVASTSISTELVFQENGGSYNFISTNVINSTNWSTQYSLYATADMTSMIADFGVVGSANSGSFDTASLAQVLTPSTTGVTIVSSAGGSSYNWATDTMTSELNDSSGYTYTIDAATAPNVWGATVATQPHEVFFNGSLGTNVSSSLSISGPYQWSATANTVYVYSTSNPATAFTSPGIEAAQRNNAVNMGTASYLTFSNLDFKDANLDNVFMGGAAIDANSGIVINSSTIEWAYRDAYAYNNADVSGAISGDRIENSTIQYNGGNGVDWGIVNYSDLLITGNNVHTNCQIPASISYCSGIYISSHQTGGTGTIISKNLVDNNGTSSLSSIQGNGIWADTDTGVTIEDNEVWGNLGNGLVLENNISSTVAYNVAWGNGQGGGGGWWGDTTLLVVADSGTSGLYDASGNSIYNNTLYGGQVGARILGQSPNILNTTLFRNNIIEGSRLCNLYIDTGANNNGTNGSGNIYDHNALGAPGSTLAYWAGVGALTTYSGLDTAYGSSMNNVQREVQFMNTSTDEFWLSSSSPAIDAGANLGSVYQLALSSASVWPNAVAFQNQNNYGAGWDVGAYVYGATNPPLVSIAAPASGSVLSGTQTIIASSSAVSPASISSVSFYLDGSLLGTATSSPYTYRWNTSAASAGSHVIEILATDNYGSTASTTVSISIQGATTTGSVSTVAVGGGGSGGGFSTPVSTSTSAPIPSEVSSTTPPSEPSSTFAFPTSTGALEAMLSSLEAELASLQAKATGLPVNSSAYVFARNLALWDRGRDVQELQQYLIDQNAGPAAERLKIHGTTQIFGMLTLNALIEFQKAINITPASGYFGPITRSYISSK